jgi:hypothetical protein
MYFFKKIINLDPHPQGTMWGEGGLVVSWRILTQTTTLLDDINTATTKKLDFKNSHLTSVGANRWAWPGESWY